METITVGNKTDIIEKQLHGYNDCRHEKVDKLGLRASIFFYLGAVRAQS